MCYDPNFLEKKVSGRRRRTITSLACYCERLKYRSHLRQTLYFVVVPQHVLRGSIRSGPESASASASRRTHAIEMAAAWYA